MNSGSVLLRIIDRPRKAMEGVVTTPRSWWLPALLLVASALALNVISAPLQAELTVAQSEQMLARFADQMPAEQLELARERLLARDPVRTALLSSAVAIVIGAVGWLVRGGLGHFGSMAVGGSSTWLPTFAVTVWSLFPFVVRDIVQSVYIALQGELIEHQGLASFVATGNALSSAGDPLYLALSQVDPFVAWHWILLALGLGAATELGTVKAFFLGLFIWALIAGAKVGVAVLSAGLAGGLMG